METHKFISHSAEDAVAQIQARLGPDAVVLEVRKLRRRIFRGEQFEITATVKKEKPADPVDELRAEIRQLQQSITKSAPRESFLASLLVQSGLLPVYAERIAGAASQQIEGMSIGEQNVYVREILKANWREAQPLTARVHIFVGTPGCGKSTVICKWLAQHILGENRGAEVCQLDTHTANLSPQPRIYAEILGARFTRSIPAAPVDSLFVDLPGIVNGDENGREAARGIISEFPHPAVHLVLNGAYEPKLLLEQVSFFSSLAPESLILTHLDEECRWGKFWNLIFGTKIGIRFLSVGQNVPEGLLPGSAAALFQQEFCENRPVSRNFEAGKPSAKHPSEFVGR